MNIQKKPDVTLVLACYNEAPIFEQSVARIREAMDAGKFSYEIIFVDDASTDRTPTLIRNICQRASLYRAFFHPINQGRGKTVADGVMRARGTVVGYIDIDCEVSPVYIPFMVSQILHKKADIVTGKRYYRTSFVSLYREVISRGYQRISDLMLGTGGMDTETGYKFFDRKKILPILKTVENTGWFWDTEIMVRAKRAGLRIAEVPVLFIRRFDKHSSVHVFRDSVAYLTNLWEFRNKKI
jgi:hypothetical protein